MSLGEWWIEDRWTTTHADGEIGEMRHECVVLERAICELCNEIREKLPSWELAENYEGDYHWFVEDLNNTESEDYWQSMLDAGIEYKTIDRALNMNQDHRIVGMRDYGWTAVRGFNLDAWSLTRKQIKDIGEALLDIADELGVSIADQEFNIETFCNHRRFTAKPMDMLDGNIRSNLSPIGAI